MSFDGLLINHWSINSIKPQHLGILRHKTKILETAYDEPPAIVQNSMILRSCMSELGH